MAKYLQILDDSFSLDPEDKARLDEIVKQYLAENPPSGGEDGKDGISPTISITKIDGGHRLTITDANGSDSFDILDGAAGANGKDGADGAPGKDGENGKDGSNGKDGYSPTIEVTEIEGGYRLSITDATGFTSVDIRDGVDGQNGTDGANGKDGEDGYTPQKGVDYFTAEEISDIAKQAADLVELPEVTIDQVLPSQVIFPEGKQTTYEVGKVKLTNGIAELVPPGGTLDDFFNNFIDEKNPTTTDPSVSLTFSQAKAYEVGTKVSPTYSASLNPGSYTYGPDTGVTASAWAVTDTAGNSRTTASGSFPQLTVSDGISYKITAKATHGAGATPVTNTKQPYEAGKIAAGTKSATSGAVTGYRNTFYGTMTAKNAPTSAIVRALSGKSGKALANGSSFTITIPVGVIRVVFAYPATLRDVNSVKDVNGMNAEIKSSFVKSTLKVEGAGSYTAIDYKVYILDFAEANGTANKFTVQI